MTGFVPLDTPVSNGRFVPLGGERKFKAQTGRYSKGGKKEGKSVGGLLENLGAGARDAIIGIPGGLKVAGEAVAHDVGSVATPGIGGSRQVRKREKSEILSKVVKPTIESYKDTYGRGWTGLYENPFGVALDVLTVASLGTGGAVKAGLAPATGAAAGKRLAAGKASKFGKDIESVTVRTSGGEDVSRVISRSPLRGYSQVAADKALKKIIPADRTRFGERARAGKIQTRDLKRVNKGRERAGIQLQKATEKLKSPHERVAAYLVATLPDPQALEAHIEQLRNLPKETKYHAQAQASAALMEKARPAYDAALRAHQGVPDKQGARVLQARDAIAKLSARGRELSGSLVGDVAAADRPFLHLRLAGGAKFEKDMVTPGKTIEETKVAATPRTPEAVSARIEKIEAELAPHHREILKALRALRAGDVNLSNGRKTGDRYMTERDKFLSTGKNGRFNGRGQVSGSRAADEEARVRQYGGELPAQDVAGVRARPSAESEAWKLLYEYGRKPGADPRLRRLAHLMDELEALRELDLANRGAAVFGDDAPGYGFDLRVSRESREMPGEKLGQGIYGGASIEEIRAGLLSRNLPEPVYVPDVPELVKGGGGPRVGGGAGGRQNLPGSLKQNKGTLFTLGRLIQDPSVMSQGYLRTVRFAHYSDLYTEALRSAQWIERGDAIPAGWERIPLPARPFVATLDGREVIVGRSAERVSRLDLNVDSLDDWAASNLGDDFQVDAPSKKLADAFQKVESGDDALTGAFLRTADGKLVRQSDELAIVPSNYLRSLRGEFTRAGRLVYMMNRYPLRVWRSLVLNLRPAWLVNNIVGNGFLYLVGQLDRHGIAALGSAFRDTIRSKEGRASFDRLMDETFPTQAEGTFIDTQLPRFDVKSKTGRRAIGVVESLAKVDRAFEATIRRAAVRAELKRHPLIARQARQMRADIPDFYAASQKALGDNPKYIAEIEERVNATLGDFGNLSSFERNYVRNVFPFWAWYRAITGVVLKLPLEHPVRSELLAKLGEVGLDANAEGLGVEPGEVPPWFLGSIPIGPEKNGRVPAIPTSGINPMGTVPELGRFVASVLAGKPGEAGESLPGLSPFYKEMIEGLTGRDLQTGGRIPGRGGIVGAGKGFVESLPQAKLIEAAAGRQYHGTPAKPTLYENTLRDFLARYSGVPYANVSPRRAEQIKDR